MIVEDKSASSAFIRFFSDKDVFYGFWRVLVMAGAFSMVLGTAWFHEFKNNVLQQQEQLVKVQLDQKATCSALQERMHTLEKIMLTVPSKAAQNCERLSFLEKELSKKADREEVSNAMLLFSQKIDALRSDMSAFNIKILEYLRDNAK